MPTTIAKKLLETLETIDRPTAFCVGESVPIIMPGLEINGVGPIGLPINKSQAKELISICHQAPYGKKEKTLVDTSVRRVWAIDSNHLKLTNPQWPDFLDATLERVQHQLGLEDQDHQLLVYEPGGFFLPHQDGEKLDGMVATLVVTLPSNYEGGELIIRHCGHEETIDFGGSESAFNLHVAAFYADCEHEIRPLKTGYRIALVYNITLKRSKKTIKAPQYNTQVSEIAKLLQNCQTTDDPIKLAVILDHEYTKTGLEPDLLKGTDRAKVQALFAAAQEAGWKAYLSLLTLHESGDAECDYYDSYDYDDEPECYTMGEVYDQSLVADHWTNPTGDIMEFGKMDVDEEELISNIELRDVDSEEEVGGYTGNAGVEMERWYRHGAVILWPNHQHFEILCNTGIHSAIAGLQYMIKLWQNKKSDDELKQQCMLFAQTILKRWPVHHDNFHCPGINKENDTGSKMPALLNKLGNPSLIATYVGDTLIRDAREDPKRTVAALCQQHEWLTFQKPLLKLFKSSTENTIARNIVILESLCVHKNNSNDRHTLCNALAPEILEALKRVDRGENETHNWQKKQLNRSELIVSLFKSIFMLPISGLLAELIDYIVNLPKKYDLTTVQIPALIQLESWMDHKKNTECKPLINWLKACHAELKSRSECKPKPPQDWKRPAKLSCSCSDCNELSHFLNSPTERTHRFRIRKDRRQHLHQIIERHQCDSTHVTERYGSPHTLVCEKTQRAYERRLQAYKLDCEHLTIIEAIAIRFNAI